MFAKTATPVNSLTLRHDIFTQVYFVRLLLTNFASSFETDLHYAGICKYVLFEFCIYFLILNRSSLFNTIFYILQNKC